MKSSYSIAELVNALNKARAARDKSRIRELERMLSEQLDEDAAPALKAFLYAPCPPMAKRDKAAYQRRA